MATQLSVAYSDRVEAIGIMAGPPYLCARASSTKALTSCLIMPVDLWGIPVPDIFLPKRDTVDLENLIAGARGFASQGSIPPLSNLSAQRVWVSRGQRDKVCRPECHTSRSGLLLLLC